ncbi:tetratricopeptide repeat protein [Zobellella sp. An-6]|uniref:tetratricopeptide repeat protein n=1 Tax=Zobellella sp. An-6 TaxID=3400218 RepID=UPI004042E24D
MAQVQLSLVQQQLAQESYYSALATLDALADDSPRARLLRGDLLRLVDRGHEAESWYLGLTKGCMAAGAYHGLALLEAEQGKMTAALAHFRQAINLAPTDTDIRNDYGFALLAVGQDREARVQLMTALELEPDHGIAARNLWFLLLKHEQLEAADHLARRFGWDEQERHRFIVAARHFQPWQEGVR